jgi:hypothetical protein
VFLKQNIYQIALLWKLLFLVTPPMLGEVSLKLDTLSGKAQDGDLEMARVLIYGGINGSALPLLSQFHSLVKFFLR